MKKRIFCGKHYGVSGLEKHTPRVMKTTGIKLESEPPNKNSSRESLTSLKGHAYLAFQIVIWQIRQTFHRFSSERQLVCFTIEQLINQSWPTNARCFVTIDQDLNTRKQPTGLSSFVCKTV